MIYLNLTSGFKPFSSEEEIEFENFIFPGGEPHIKIKYNQDLVLSNLSKGLDKLSICITTRISSSEDFILLCMAKDAVERTYHPDEIHLFIPYFPGGRQDRDSGTGEPFSVGLYSNLVNNLYFDSVKIFDPHSDVTPALIDDVIVEGNENFVSLALRDYYRNFSGEKMESDFQKNSHKFNNWLRHSGVLLISPDSGSNKKINKLSKFLLESTEKSSTNPTNLSVINCDKKRDVSTGKLSEFKVYSEDLEGRTCFIVDDICDGGGTFLGLSKELKKKNSGKLILIVSHGIFSKGFSELIENFDHIYFTDSFELNIEENKELIDSGKLIQIKYSDIPL